MILFNPTSSYLWLNKGTEVNKNSTSYTSVVSPQKKKKKKRKSKKRKIKKGSGARLGECERLNKSILHAPNLHPRYKCVKTLKFVVKKSFHTHLIYEGNKQNNPITFVFVNLFSIRSILCLNFCFIMRTFN